MASIQGVYVALFGRPADPTGLAFFNGVTKNGTDLSAINNLAGEKEYTDRFAGQSNVQIVNSIYISLFNRPAEATGLNFFVDALNKGTLNINNIAIAILDGAQGNDKTIATNKIAAADLFTAALDTPSEIGSYTGANAAASARTWLSTVTTTAATQAQVDAAVAAVGVIGTGGLTLNVASTDVVSPTAADVKFKTGDGDDTVNVSTSGAVTALANVDGGFGTDTVAIKSASAAGTNAVGAVAGVAGTAQTVTAAPTYANVEKLSVSVAGGNGGNGGTGVNGGAGANVAATLDLTNSASIKQVWSDSSSAGTAGAAGTGGGLGGVAGTSTVTVSNIADGATLGLKGNNDTVSFGFKTAQTGTTSITLDTAKATTSFTVTNGAETVALSTTGGSSITSFIDTTVKTLNITGSGNLSLITTGTNVTALNKVDASALTGALTIDLAGTTQKVALTGTLNADTITLDAPGQADTITYLKGEKSNFALAESVTNFTAGVDKIDLKAFGFTKTGAVELTNIQDGSSVFASSSVAFKAIDTNADGVADTTYVFADTNGDGVLQLNSDFAVKFVGNIAFTAADFVLV